LLKEMIAGKIEPRQAISSIVLSKELPRNDNFARLYRSDVKCDMVFVLRGEEFKCHQIVFNTSEFLQSCMKQNNDANYRQNGQHLRI